MRVLIIEIMFIASTLPLWRAEFDVTDYIDLNSYVLYAAAFWIFVFTFDILRIWWKSRPKKHRIDGFEAIEIGVPHARFIQTREQSYTIFLRTSVPALQMLSGFLGPAGIALTILFSLNNVGWVAGTTVLRISLEIVTAIYALGYSLSAISPTKIEIHPSFIAINNKRFTREHFGQFHPGNRLSYSYGDKMVEFGGYWESNKAVAIVTGLNDLYDGRRWLPEKTARSAAF